MPTRRHNPENGLAVALVAGLTIVLVALVRSPRQPAQPQGKPEGWTGPPVGIKIPPANDDSVLRIQSALNDFRDMPNGLWATATPAEQGRWPELPEDGELTPQTVSSWNVFRATLLSLGSPAPDMVSVFNAATQNGVPGDLVTFTPDLRRSVAGGMQAMLSQIQQRT